MKPVEPAGKRRDAREGDYCPQSPAGVMPHDGAGEDAGDGEPERARDPPDGQENEKQREPNCELPLPSVQAGEEVRLVFRRGSRFENGIR